MNVFKICLPMMISSLSSHIMLVMDQLILSHYSIDAMTGASSASAWCSTLQCAAMSITGIAGAFAGNYNGAGKYELVSGPIWQMIWFSFTLFCISIPISKFGGAYCIPKNLQTDGIPFFQMIMFFTPISGIYYSLSAFFIAIGKGLLVTIAAIVANLVNASVDLILVFGCFGIDRYTGSIGAAIGTVTALFVNVSLLFSFFLRKEMRDKYKTSICKLNIQKLKQYLRLSIVGGLGHIFELGAWSIVYYSLATLGKEIALIQSIAVSVNLLLAFAVSGLEKGVISITANLLGAKQKYKVISVLKTGIKIHVILCSCLSFIFFFFPEFITDRFIKFEVSPETVELALSVLKLVWVYFLFDGCCWVIAGIIEGGGDLNYSMVTIAIGLCSGVATPVVILNYLGRLNIITTWILLICTVITITTALYRRYRSDKWIHIYA
ncbi:MAG: hypothetical protein LBE97_00190 [Holosporales bacterium]|nr:hypothetical protein [Holosporales bacterium]